MSDPKNAQDAVSVRLRRFAWMGISFLMPETWALGRYQGNFNEGNLRIDDLLQERISVVWKRVRQPDVDKFVEAHLKATEQQAKKNKLPFESSRRLRMLPNGGELFSWRSDAEALNLCVREGKEQCRLFVIRVLGRPGEKIRPVAEKIIESLELDRGQKDFRWTVYGLDVRLPRDLIPTDFSFKTGCTRLLFEKPNERLEIEKIAPASVIMQGLSLFDWLQASRQKVLSAYNFTGEQEKIQGHTGAHFRGKLKRRWSKDYKQFDYWGWVCDKENKLITYFHQYPCQEKAKIKFEIDKAWCHPPSGAENPGVLALPSEVSTAVLPRTLDAGGKSEKALSRSQMLASVPVRNEAIKWELKDDAVELKCDLQLKWAGRILTRLSGANRVKKFSLDAMGGFVWRFADGKATVRELVDRLAEEYKLEQVEAHAALLAFLRGMMKKRLMGLYVPEK